MSCAGTPLLVIDNTNQKYKDLNDYGCIDSATLSKLSAFRCVGVGVGVCKCVGLSGCYRGCCSVFSFPSSNASAFSISPKCVLDGVELQQQLQVSLAAITSVADAVVERWGIRYQNT